MNEPSNAPSQPMAPVPVPDTSAGHPHTKNALFIGLAVLMGIIIVLLAYVVLRKDEPMQPTAPTPAPATSTQVTTPTIMNGEDAQTGVLDIDWQSGRIVDPTAAFGGKITANDVTRTVLIENDLEGTPATSTVKTYSYAFYEHGSVKSGPYQGQKVFSAMLTSGRSIELGVDAGIILDRLTLLVDQAGAVRAVGVSRPALFPEWSGVAIAPNLSLRLSEFPAQLTLSNGKTVTRRISPMAKVKFDPLCTGGRCLNRLPVGQTADGRGLYTGNLDGGFVGTFGTGGLNDPLEPGCVILYREDGEGAIYESVIPPSQPPQIRQDESSPVPEIGPQELLWDAAYANTSTFRAHRVGGCGGWTCAEILTPEKMADDDIQESDLVRAGQTRSGDPIYVFRQARHTRHSYYFRPVQNAHEEWWEIDPLTQEKPNIEEFLRRFPVPVFLWKDALGRWVVYKNAAAFPLAECGKPVIYLYPERTTDIHVKLPNFVNVTVSEPTYPKEGWHVRATPAGALTLASDQSAWSSLFWEGTGVNYPVPETGFVVKQQDVASFLERTLAKYGLNAQESKDFMDFWVPEMQGAPYYRISFLTDTWSASVPLAVKPAPRTSIRLFMDWKKLTAPISLAEPTIVTPVRNGYTLVEWGGLLR